MKSLEYYAKRGLLGLDAHDAAHSGDTDTLQKMFPGMLVAQNSTGVAQNSPGVSKAIVAKEFGGPGAPPPAIERDTAAEQDMRNKTANDRLQKMLDSGASPEEVAKIKSRLSTDY